MARPYVDHERGEPVGYISNIIYDMNNVAGIVVPVER